MHMGARIKIPTKISAALPLHDLGRRFSICQTAAGGPAKNAPLLQPYRKSVDLVFDRISFLLAPEVSFYLPKMKRPKGPTLAKRLT